MKNKLKYFVLNEVVTMNGVMRDIFNKIIVAENFEDAKQKLIHDILKDKFSIQVNTHKVIRFEGVALKGEMKNMEHEIIRAPRFINNDVEIDVL